MSVLPIEECECEVCRDKRELIRRLRSEPSDEPGRKDDAGKLRYTLLPWKAVDEVVRVLEHGAQKYGEDNWQRVPEARRRYLDAALRHIVAVTAAGEDKDRDSGRHHLAHAVCSLLFILEFE